MAEQEGVIKYQLEFQSGPLRREAFSWFDLNAFNACRSQMLGLGLIGQTPERYQGYGFGNLSWRDPQQTCCYLISGSQTGHLETLTLSDCARVLKCDPQRNYLKAEGETVPSSESMTHSAVYMAKKAIQAGIRAVVHVHSPDIWHNARQLGLASTASDIPYGTPDMAAAVVSLTDQLITERRDALFTMEGHEDGVLAFGESLESAAELLIRYLKLARINRENQS